MAWGTGSSPGAISGSNRPPRACPRLRRGAPAMPPDKSPPRRMASPATHTKRVLALTRLSVPLLVGIGGIPSSSGASPKGLIYAADTGNCRTLYLNSMDGSGYGPVSAGTVSLSGAIGVNGATPPAKAADPGTATSTDAAVINAFVTNAK